jgi:hypothetical protein
MDLGDGRRTPELRVTIPRTVPYQAPWMGVGGGREDLLPPVPFPWPYALPLLLPLAGLVWLAARRRREGAPARRRKAARKAFARRWPPAPDRESLDAAHAAGRELLAAFQGEEARSWGGEELEARGLEVWSRWVRSLDAARFARQEPSFPPLQALLAALERP